MPHEPDNTAPDEREGSLGPGSFPDRLREATRRCGAAVCVGLDPVWEKLPQELRGSAADAPEWTGGPTKQARAHGPRNDRCEGHGPGGLKGEQPDGVQTARRVEAIEHFSLAVIEAVRGVAPAVKIQSACFERYGWRGVRAFETVIEKARESGLLTIADVKRGDIGVSSEHYAEAFSFADAITVSPYLGLEGIEPFVQASVRRGGHQGIFVLVRTSNPGGDALQWSRLAESEANKGRGERVAERVGRLVHELGRSCRSEHAGGYSIVGAVVGATKGADMAALRRTMPYQWFLMPGIGAQGAHVMDVAPCVDEHGLGALITASRSVTYAFASPESHAADERGDWRRAIREAAERLVDDARLISSPNSQTS